MNTTKFAQCKRCGSQRVTWVQNKTTHSWYLAFATNTSVFRPGDVTAHAHLPHKCDVRTRGGFDPCPACNRHHTLADTAGTHCGNYPDAPTAPATTPSERAQITAAMRERTTEEINAIIDEINAKVYPNRDDRLIRVVALDVLIDRP